MLRRIETYQGRISCELLPRFLVEKTHASRENYLILSARDRPAGEPRLADPPGLVPLTLRVLVGDAEATGRP
jgi:hypothetical protein